MEDDVTFAVHPTRMIRPRSTPTEMPRRKRPVPQNLPHSLAPIDIPQDVHRVTFLRSSAIMACVGPQALAEYDLPH